MRLWLIRHGETQANIDGLYSGHAPTPLTARGIEQAQNLHTLLHGVSFDLVLCSELERAQHTARRVLSDRQLPVQIIPELNEMFFGERAIMAANIINEKRGWIQSEEIGIHHRQEISNICIEILRSMEKFSWQQYETELKKRGYKVHLQEKDGGGVYGYSIKRGNSTYKSSVLGIGRNLTPSKIETTWAKLHSQKRKFESKESTSRQARTTDRTPVIQPSTISQPVMKHYDIMTDEYHKFHVEIPEAADNIIRQDCSLEDAHPFAKIEEIQHTALLLFAGYLNAATSIAASSGGGGSDTGGWGRDKDEDELEWARRCARMANSMCKRKKGLHR